jgi:hypothetical protein
VTLDVLSSLLTLSGSVDAARRPLVTSLLARVRSMLGAGVSDDGLRDELAAMTALGNPSSCIIGRAINIEATQGIPSIRLDLTVDNRSTSRVETRNLREGSYVLVVDRATQARQVARALRRALDDVRRRDLAPMGAAFSAPRLQSVEMRLVLSRSPVIQPYVLLAYPRGSPHVANATLRISTWNDVVRLDS